MASAPPTRRLDQQQLLRQEQAASLVPHDVQPLALKELAGSPRGEKAALEVLKDIDLSVRIELGRTQMYLEDVLKLQSGSVVILDKLAGDPVDVLANGRIVARGEVVVLNDKFCVRITELVAGSDCACD